MDQIKPLEKINKRKKLSLKVINFLKIRVMSYGVAAGLGAFAGSQAQDYTRGVTEYSPIKHEQLLAEKEKRVAEGSFEDFKKQREIEKQKGFLGWFMDKTKKIKEGILNPKEFITNTEMYKDLYIKYFEVLKLIDNIAFLLPALLILIMLGGFLTRKLENRFGDPVAKLESEKMREKVNELVVAFNRFSKANTDFTAESLTPKEIEDLRVILLSARESLPESDLL